MAQQPPDEEDDLPPTRDPRLEIPEILRKPVPQSNFDPVTGGSKTSQPQPMDTAGMGRAWAMGFDFVFTVIAGVALGWLIDWWLKSSPIGILCGVGLGFASGLVRMIRSAKRQEGEAKERRAARK